MSAMFRDNYVIPIYSSGDVNFIFVALHFRLNAIIIF